MQEYKKKEYIGERALFNTHNLLIEDCRFFDGESPLKESSDLSINKTTFSWKYPLWYCTNVNVLSSLWDDTARSGIWYTNNITIKDTIINAPKQFRRCDGVSLDNVKLNYALETLWNCKNIHITNTYIKGDYFGMNCENVFIDNITVDGNYILDGAKNITISNSTLNSKDAFWNCENVVVKNCKIIGEYLCWNTKNIRFINCTIESNQGMCYVKDLVLEDCKLFNTDLAFEYSTVDAKVLSTIDSIKNPISGKIEALGIDEVIFDNNSKSTKDDTLIKILQNAFSK